MKNNRQNGHRTNIDWQESANAPEAKSSQDSTVQSHHLQQDNLGETHACYMT